MASSKHTAPVESTLPGREHLRRLVENKRTLIVVGAGGVGKTTTAAALGVQAARLGRTVLVLTVDPAKRLATSLGLEAFGNEEVAVAEALFSEAGVPLGEGSLSAMMLDTKSTFDSLIRRYASPATQRRIMHNPFYLQASTALAGSQEYMAMEKLYEVRESSRYDLIILDTPPTSNALDFLEAPNRMEDFLGSNSIRVLTRSLRSAGRMGFGIMRLNRWVFKGLNRFIGAESFFRLLEFIESFQEMYDGFKTRARRVRDLFRQEDVAFIIVSATDQASIDEAFFFHDELRRNGMPFGSLLVNRVREERVPPSAMENLEAHLKEQAQGLDLLAAYSEAHVDALLRSVDQTCRSYATLVAFDEERLAEVTNHLASHPEKMLAVPLFQHDIHHIKALASFGDRLVDVS